MLLCKYCDFFKRTAPEHSPEPEEVCYCELTGIRFEDDVENLDMDHPCHCLNHVA